MNIQLNQWESDFFGRKIYQLQPPFSFGAGHILHLPTEGLLQAKVATTDFESQKWLQAQHFQLVETEITFTLDLSFFHSNQTACHCRIATEKDLKPLKTWIKTAFPSTRFRPPYFTMEENQRFYQHWIENAVAGKFDDLCFLAEEKGKQQGVASIRYCENQVKLGLLAVEPAYQRQGIAKNLLFYVISYIQQAQINSQRKIDYLVITTQLSNLKAIQLYQSLGAKITESYYWFYRG